ncbi:MAG: hypothetical protein U9Q74_04570 [Gemmatimonadota bacterium]|nr:hypothetical protein [Gemmatimonadota bacterium]
MTAATRHAVVRAMMREAIDYAGLFPPAALGMDEAVRNFAAYRRGPHAWMLGRFVVPVARLEELAAAYATAQVPDGPPWPLSVIARAADAPALAAFNARYGGRLHIDTVEAPPVAAAGVAALAALSPTYVVYAEVDIAHDPAPVVAELARHGLRAKVRTGGVKAEAIPTPGDVARFIAACHAARVPFKATAGLHHAWRAVYPLTYAPDAPRGTMFGFANVVFAGAAASGGAGAGELADILAAGESAFSIEDAGAVLPSGRAVPAALVEATRAGGLQSFGSCSFDEPVAELTERGLL